MRLLFGALFALALGACTGDITVDGDTPPGEAYTVEIRASEAEQTFVVHAPDGRVVGGRAANGVSALMEASSIQALAGAPEAEAPRGEVSMRMPGFSLDVDSDDGEADGGGRVAINIGAGGHGVQVNADDGGPGDGDDRAFIRLTGLDADDVRQVITEADELSPSVQAQMLAELGLEE